MLTPDYQEEATARAVKRGLFGGLPAAWVQAQVVRGLTAAQVGKILDDLKPTPTP